MINLCFNFIDLKESFSVIMHESKTMDKRFDVIDLDPYGSPSHFLDATIQAISEGGIIVYCKLGQMSVVQSLRWY